ncbi:hypothetical protein PAECIP111893_03893 [Paenibacillus plantiphilus]|uniref:Calx-beta domain-containing protein n=1 Tax=Paenibacillus plantiphilus TaxID=2905650 RepID=A0ABN8GUE6_9BACL|nr:Calx-beta domain-containing protein [Paenibacillus plantiphilus]CAH1215209.1 hypothetical protein PAECIP111893_03893 [Paenibacillus plantiphilus]
MNRCNIRRKASRWFRVLTASLLAAVWVLTIFQGGAAAAGNSAAAVNGKLVPPNDMIDFGFMGLGIEYDIANATPGYIDIPLYRWFNTKGEARVDYETYSITGVPGCDYVETSGTVVFADGELKKTIRVWIPVKYEFCTNDAMFGVKLLDPSTGEVKVTNDYEIWWYVFDEDAEPRTIEVYARCTDIENVVPCDEQNEGENVIFRIAPNYPTNSRVTVDYTITSDTAIAGVDYTGPVSGTAVIAPGEYMTEVVVPTINDGLQGPNKSITITLSNPTGNAVLSSEIEPSLTVPIVDTPAPSTIEFKDPIYYSIEETKWVDVEVVRKGNTKGRISAEYYLFSNTATFGVDLLGDPLNYGNPWGVIHSEDGTITFEDGETKKNIRVKLVDDSLKEYRESFGIVLSANRNNRVRIGDKYVAEVVIYDTDHLPKK